MSHQLLSLLSEVDNICRITNISLIRAVVYVGPH